MTIVLAFLLRKSLIYIITIGRFFLWKLRRFSPFFSMNLLRLLHCILLILDEKSFLLRVRRVRWWYNWVIAQVHCLYCTAPRLRFLSMVLLPDVNFLHLHAKTKRGALARPARKHLDGPATLFDNQLAKLEAWIDSVVSQAAFLRTPPELLLNLFQLTRVEARSSIHHVHLQKLRLALKRCQNYDLAPGSV